MPIPNLPQKGFDCQKVSVIDNCYNGIITVRRLNEVAELLNDVVIVIDKQIYQPTNTPTNQHTHNKRLSETWVPLPNFGT